VNEALIAGMLGVLLLGAAGLCLVLFITESRRK
jgi:hypothetical protein